MNAVRRTQSSSLISPAGLTSLAGLIRWVVDAVVDAIVGPPAPVPVPIPVRAQRDRRPRR